MFVRFCRLESSNGKTMKIMAIFLLVIESVIGSPNMENYKIKEHHFVEPYPLPGFGIMCFWG